MSNIALTSIDAYNRHAEKSDWPSYADQTLSFEAEPLREALNVWNSARNGRDLPERQDMAPRVMKAFLNQIAIIDAVIENGRRRYRVRIAGTALDAAYGNLKVEWIDKAIGEPSRSRWHQTLDLCFDVRGPVRTIGIVGFNDMNYLEVETLIAPLGRDIDHPVAVFIALNLQSASKRSVPLFSARSHSSARLGAG